MSTDLEHTAHQAAALAADRARFEQRGLEAEKLAYDAAYQMVVLWGADPGRALRGAHLVVSGEARPYATTCESCTCPDHVQNGHVCKHMLAARFRQYLSARSPAPAPQAQVAC